MYRLGFRVPFFKGFVGVYPLKEPLKEPPKAPLKGSSLKEPP